MEISTTIIWLVVGVVLFFAEMGLPGVGLMFAGAGALTVGMFLNFALIPAEAYLIHLLIFVTATAVWAAILWKPIQKLRPGKKAPYHNMIGEMATVSAKGVDRNDGEVLWSGALMKARLADNSAVEKLESGAVVIIQDINGNVLTVSPK